MQLNYRSQTTQEGLVSRNWMNDEDECEDRVPGVTSCDEYPFFASEQGGPLAAPLPDLELVDAAQNTAAGGRYGNFVTSCDLQEAGFGGQPKGDAFFVIPVFPGAQIDTTYLCNGWRG